MGSESRGARAAAARSWTHALRSALALAAAVLLLGGLALVVWRNSRPDQLTDIEGWQYCKAWYERAATAAESAAVDGRRPVVAGRYAAYGLQCRVLRDRYGAGRGRLTTR